MNFFFWGNLSRAYEFDIAILMQHDIFNYKW